MDWEEENATKPWTVVVSRKRKNHTNRKNNAAKPIVPFVDDVGSPHQTRSDVVVSYQAQLLDFPFQPGESGPLDREEENHIMNKMQYSLKKLEESPFYNKFLEQLQSPEVLNSLIRVAGVDSQLQVVVYGIGSIGNSERSRLQLSLALLLKQRFCWVGDIEVFDPVVSASEKKVMESLGCTFVDVNEQGRRTAKNPTLFFMPHCEAFLYDNVLQANWSPQQLSRIVLFGNSFSSYIENYYQTPPMHVLAIAEHTIEFGINTVCSDFFPAFNNMSWHFFALDPLVDLNKFEL